MIQAFTESLFKIYISTEDNRIDTSVDKSQIRHLFKFINDMDGSIQYAYGYREDIFNRYTELGFAYDFVPDVYAGKTKLLPSGHYKYEVYEVSWIGTVAVALNTAPATETDVLLPINDDKGVVNGLVTKGILNVTELEGTEQVQYTQHAEPDGDNYIWYGGGAAPENTFTFSVNTANTSADSSSSSQYKLPLVDVGAINMKVYWGDGSDDTITAYDQAEVLHTYGSPGIYTINIENEVRGWQQYDSPTGNKKDHLKILEISKWNNFTITDKQAFAYSENMTVTATDKPAIETTNLSFCFRECSNFNTTIDDWDVSAVISLSYMFEGCTLFNQPLNSWNTSLIISLSHTFRNCTAFNQPLDNWDTSLVTHFTACFDSASIFNKPLGSWDMGSAVFMAGMLSNATAFDQDISGWDVRSLTSTTAGAQDFMAGNALSITNYDLLLVLWDANTPVAPSVIISFGNSQYTLGGVAEASRTNLISTHGWTITDGGGI